METDFDRIRGRRRRGRAIANYERNSAAEKGETSTAGRVVNDQNGATGRAFVYGKYPASHNMCEVIAVHNAKVLLGVESTLSETAARFQTLGAMIFAGFLGSNVYKIGRVLKSYGIEYKRVFRKKKLSEDGLYIISFWNEKPLKNGLHTVAAERKDGAFTVYNLYGNGRECRESGTGFAKRFITAYYLGNTEDGRE